MDIDRKIDELFRDGITDICFNDENFREFIYRIVDEMLDRGVDGVYFNQETEGTITLEFVESNKCIGSNGDFKRSVYDSIMDYIQQKPNELFIELDGYEIEISY